MPINAKRGRESIDLQYTEIYGTFTHPNNDAKARTTFDTSQMIQYLQHTYLHINVNKIDIGYHLIGNSHPILAGVTDSRSNCRLPDRSSCLFPATKKVGISGSSFVAA